MIYRGENVQNYEQPDIPHETTKTTKIQRGNPHQCLPKPNTEPLHLQRTSPYINQSKCKKRNDKTATQISQNHRHHTTIR